MFNSNTFICCRKCTFKMCFLNIPLNLANILAFCNISCKLISTYMKECLFNTHFMLILVLLLLQSGDVEVNPGPASSDHGSLSIIHSNIRSVRNKLDYIKEQFLDFNIICLTETHLDISVPTESLLFENFDSPYRKDRTNHGGGVMLYISDGLLHKRRPELEIYCDESIWVEVRARNESFLLGLFYSPRTADANFFEGY